MQEIQSFQFLVWVDGIPTFHFGRILEQTKVIAWLTPECINPPSASAVVSVASVVLVEVMRAAGGLVV